jgi:hypothetical protein
VIPGVEELGAAVGMMRAADRMVMVRMGMPVQTPTPVDVAIVRTPVDADAGEDPEQDPCIEHAGVEPVPRATGVHPLVREETRKHERCHDPIRSLRSRNVASVESVIGCGFRARQALLGRS